MKKEKIYSLIIACICLVLWFMPIVSKVNSLTYVFTIRVLFSPYIFSFAEHLRDLFVVLLGFLAIIFSIINAIKSTAKTKILASVASGIYVLMWVLALFVVFPYRNNIIFELNYRTSIIWIVLYFAMLLTIIVLTVLQWLPPRRPTKAARLEARVAELEQQVACPPPRTTSDVESLEQQIAELQKQVDELKDKDKDN